MQPIDRVNADKLLPKKQENCKDKVTQGADSLSSKKQLQSDFGEA